MYLKQIYLKFATLFKYTWVSNIYLVFGVNLIILSYNLFLLVAITYKQKTIHTYYILFDRKKILFMELFINFNLQC